MAAPPNPPPNASGPSGGPQQQPQGSVEKIPDDPNDVEDTDDGGAIIRVDTPAPADEGKFYDNLLPVLPPHIVASLATMLDERVREDIKSREPADKLYEQGIQRTGLGGETKGGASFSGASKVTHPVLTKACIDLEARAIAELMPPAGMVKAFVPGKPTKVRVEKAKRVAALMNWQVVKQMPEFRGELEQALMQAALAGSQYIYLVWDERKRRPVATYWPGEDVILPFGASSAMSAERITQRERISQRVFEQRVASGYYATDVDAAPSMEPDETKAGEAAMRVVGAQKPDMNLDGRREIWRIYTELELDQDPETKGELAPYVIEMTELEGSIKRIVRNWEKGDEQRAMMPWLIEVPLIPWRGSATIGLMHVIGGLTGAATGALRALLDSAHVNNFPAALKLKGANFSGQSKSMDVGTLVEIEGGIGQMDGDIRKLVMPIPYNPPSPVLFELLGFCGDQAEAVVQTTLKNLQDAAGSNLPVGTTLALIEQGMKVMSGVHQRLLAAMNQLVLVLHRINRLYITDEDIKDETGELLATRSDFNGPLDVIPVADPNIFSDAQRFAQMQMVAERAQLMPQIYDLRKVEEMILERTRIPDAKDLLVPSPNPQPNNAVNENAAMAMGRPVAAFPEQDHLAHLQTHLDFWQSPVLGQLPSIVPKFAPALLDHVAQHMALWYVEEIYERGNAQTTKLGAELSSLMHPDDPEVSKELDRFLATLSPEVAGQAQQVFAKMMPIIQQVAQVAQQFHMPQPMDPSQATLQVAQMSNQTQQQNAQLAAQTEMQKSQLNAQTTMQAKILDLRAKQQQAAQQSADKQRAEAAAAAQKEADRNAALQQQHLKAGADAALAAQSEHAESDRTQFVESNKAAMNTQDNETALTISQAEIAAGHRSNVKDGHGLNPSGHNP